MPITRHHTGRWLYLFDRIINGQRIRANKLLPAGWTRAQALAFDQRETARLFDAATGGPKPEPLIDDAVLVYLTQHAPTLKNHKDIEGALALLHPAYAGRKLSELPAVASDYASTPGLAPGTIKNRLAYLRAACRWAWKHKGMGEHDPAERMVLPKVRNARHVYLSRAEAVRVFRAMGYGWPRDAARVAFYTGWRAGEVLRATPVTVGDGLLCLSISDSKNGQPRIVPVHQKIRHLVQRHWPPQTTVWTVSKAVKAAMREVGLGHARLHDLRHSAASEMINSGIDLYTVGAVLGHKSAVSTARYAHLAAGRLADAVATIGAKRSQPAPKKKAA